MGTACPYPQSSGQVEGMNQTLKLQLSKICQKKKTPNKNLNDLDTSTSTCSVDESGRISEDLKNIHDQTPNW